MSWATLFYLVLDIACNGLDQGQGYNINIPWPNRMVGNEEYLQAISTIVCPALLGFEPQLILVASGFDAVKNDMLAGTNLDPGAYYDMTVLLKQLQIPMAVILEGGYTPELIAVAAENVVSALLGMPKPEPKENLEPNENYLNSEDFVHENAGGDEGDG